VEQPQGGLSASNNQEDLSGLNEPTQPTEPENNDKPFNDEPFDAGVEATEQDEPKKFIQQLSGKLGQSLRKYTDESGQPDFDLEKFAINSVISATHTSEMDEEDKKDIISKINNSGKNDDVDNQENGTDNSNDDSTGLGQNDNYNSGESNFNNNQENNLGESLNMSENSCNFVDKNKDMITETYDCGCDIDEVIEEIMSEPTVKPIVKPDVKPEITPSRRSRPFKVPIILPEHSPKPKAKLVTEGQIEIKPLKIWWENNPDELLKLVYWTNKQIPPVDIEKRKEAFIKIANQLDAEFPAPTNRKAEMINSIS
jgi:hypothetical protein